jgi:hypothetical protein
MKRILPIVLLLMFFVGFFVACAFRFQHLIYEQNYSSKMIATLVFLAIGSGICLLFSFRSLGLFRIHVVLTGMYGAMTGITVFFALFGIEDMLSDRRLYSESSPTEFSVLRGHCGTYVGRALIKFYHRSWEQDLQSKLTDFEISNQCRNRHFEQIVDRKVHWCKEASEPECMMKWMKAFAEHGYWNVDTRKMFLNQMNRLWSRQEKIPDGLLAEYAINDQELEAASPTLLKQAGIEDQYSDEFAYWRQKEELENLIIGKTVIDQVSRVIHSVPPPRLIELEKTIGFRYEKINEMRKDLEEMKKKFDPS